MIQEWCSLYPKNGLLSDLALLALILPGTFIAHFFMFIDDVPWFAHLLVFSIDLFFITLVTLLALFLNRWLRYCLGEKGLSIFSVGGWFDVPPQEVTSVKLVALTSNIWGFQIGINGLSGMVYGIFSTGTLGNVHLYGYAYAKRDVLLERYHGKPILLTPEAPEDFSAYLYALGYPSSNV